MCICICICICVYIYIYIYTTIANNINLAQGLVHGLAEAPAHHLQDLQLHVLNNNTISTTTTHTNNN